MAKANIFLLCTRSSYKHFFMGLSHLILKTILQDGCYYCVLFIEQETEMQTGQIKGWLHVM